MDLAVYQNSIFLNYSSTFILGNTKQEYTKYFFPDFWNLWSELAIWAPRIMKRSYIVKAMGCPHTPVSTAHLDVIIAAHPEWLYKFCLDPLPKAAKKERKTHSRQLIQSPACRLTPTQVPLLCSCSAAGSLCLCRTASSSLQNMKLGSKNSPKVRKILV